MAPPPDRIADQGGPGSPYIKRIQPALVTRLSHPVWEVKPSENGRFLVAGSNTGVSVISEDFTIRNIPLKSKIEGATFSIDCTGERIAYLEANNSSLLIHNLRTDQHKSVAHESLILDCHLDEEGRLWSIRVQVDCYVLELRSPPTGNPLAVARLGNAYFAAGLATISAGPLSGTVHIELISGQGEQENYICHLETDGKLSVRHLSAMDGEQFVFFAPYGSEAISLDHTDQRVLRFAAPFEKSIGEAPWPGYKEDESEDERPGYHATYLNDVYLLASSMEGRMFVLHTRSMQFVSELRVEGFEPVPTHVKYPSLTGEQGMVSDLIALGRCGDSLVTFFAANHGSASPAMVVIPIASILNPDPEA